MDNESTEISEKDVKNIKYVEFGEWSSEKSTHHIKMWNNNNHTGAMIEHHYGRPITGMGIFNDMMSLVEIHRGQWELFEHDNFGGFSVILGYGAHQLMDITMPDGRSFNDQLSSYRPV